MRKIETEYTGIIRIVMVALALLAQLFLLAFIVDLLKNNFYYVYLLLELLGVSVIISMVSNNKNSSYTIVWLIIILILPVFGYLLYMLWGRTSLCGKKSKKIQETIKRGQSFLEQEPNAYSQFQKFHPLRKRIFGYLLQEGFPLYNNTKCNYYPLGELQFEKMIEDMEGAENFIFLQYFIIAEGQLWDRIHDVLRRKSEQGVEVRLMYDDFGSITSFPNMVVNQLKSENIQVVAFNPVHRYISRLYINYRNHGKITVIDGNIGYTGGANIADEYVNIYKKFGHWKDTAVRLEGKAVWSLTVMFLQMWDSESNIGSNYSKYVSTLNVAECGFFQPFSDGPTNNPNNPAAVMYRQIISNSQEYVYITTPYLVIDNIIKDALCIAAKGGTDVRIITPKIPDHWYVHMVTRSNYGELMEAGVRIYEYTPGYIHEKTIISDDDNAIVGSINMDYRSFYLHFENGVWICGATVLEEIKKDITDTFALSEEINLNKWNSRPWYVKFFESILRLFAPLF